MTEGNSALGQVKAAIPAIDQPLTIIDRLERKGLHPDGIRTAVQVWSFHTPIDRAPRTCVEHTRQRRRLGPGDIFVVLQQVRIVIVCLDGLPQLVLEGT